MEASFKFLKTKRGRTHFAYVRVLLDPNPAATVWEAYDATKELAKGDERDSDWVGDWVTAAMLGAQRAANDIARCLALIPAGGRVAVAGVWGTEVDTSPAAMQCAATEAVWRAAGGTDDGRPFTLDWVGDEPTIRWSVPG